MKWSNPTDCERGGALARTERAMRTGDRDSSNDEYVKELKEPRDTK